MGHYFPGHVFQKLLLDMQKIFVLTANNESKMATISESSPDYFQAINICHFCFEPDDNKKIYIFKS